MAKSRRRKDRLDRRKFLEIASTSALGAGLGSPDSKAQATARVTPQLIDNFNRTDSAYHGDAWETLTPGHWRIQWRALRRDMAACPDPPYGMLWYRAWKLTGDYRIEAAITVRGLGASDGHELFGICFGGKSLYEGWHGGGDPGQAAWYAAWRGDGSFGVYDHSSEVPRPLGAERAGLLLRPGARVTLTVTVSEGKTDARANLTVQVQGAVNGQVVLGEVSRATTLEGYFGLLARGDVDFEVNEVRLFPGRNRPEAVALSNLVVAMPMGHTLRKTDRGWRVKVLCLFRSEGERASVRVSDHPSPQWSQVPESGEAAIVTNRFRHHTAVVDTLLPGDPSEKEFTFTVWKDGTNVTADPRVPDTVGRLPRLRAPYRLCGLSCHAISAFQFSEPEKCFPWRVQQRRWHRISNPEVYPKARLFQEGWLFEQPRPESFQHIDEFRFQILLWEDDIWYLEIPIFPHTLADVYRLIGLTLGGKVQRRMMMRHWNVLDPGDHDFGMDDVKGTEQYAVRTLDSLPQDGEYLRRNFAAVLHLVTADEKEHRTDLPARYTRWQMPRGDFSLIITDARLWPLLRRLLYGGRTAGRVRWLGREPILHAPCSGKNNTPGSKRRFEPTRLPSSWLPASMRSIRSGVRKRIRPVACSPTMQGSTVRPATGCSTCSARVKESLRFTVTSIWGASCGISKTEWWNAASGPSAGSAGAD